jgi:3-oxoacyl-(acyl-carrier-protein) synthase
VPNAARRMRIAGALSNSFGFGGTNATLAFRTL